MTQEFILVTSQYCNDDRYCGILSYDEYREFTGVTGDIQGFLDIIKWFLGGWLCNGIKYLFY